MKIENSNTFLGNNKYLFNYYFYYLFQMHRPLAMVTQITTHQEARLPVILPDKKCSQIGVGNSSKRISTTEQIPTRSLKK